MKIVGIMLSVLPSSLVDCSFDNTSIKSNSNLKCDKFLLEIRNFIDPKLYIDNLEFRNFIDPKLYIDNLEIRNFIKGLL
jgi:hypothetical protein